MTRPWFTRQLGAGVLRATQYGTASASFSYSLALPEASLGAVAAPEGPAPTPMPPGQAEGAIPGLASTTQARCAAAGIGLLSNFLRVIRSAGRHG